MNRTTTYLLGPELVWLLLFVAVGLFLTTQRTSLDRGNLIMLKLFLPSIGVLLAFVPLYWTAGSQGWLLGRIIVVSLVSVVGLVYLLSKLAGYGDIRDLGLILGFVGYVFIGFTVLGLISGLATLTLAANRSFLPLLTGILILAGLGLLYLRFQWLR